MADYFVEEHRTSPSNCISYKLFDDVCPVLIINLFTAAFPGNLQPMFATLWVPVPVHFMYTEFV